MKNELLYKETLLPNFRSGGGGVGEGSGEEGGTGEGGSGKKA